MRAKTEGPTKRIWQAFALFASALFLSAICPAIAASSTAKEMGQRVRMDCTTVRQLVAAMSLKLDE